MLFKLIKQTCERRVRRLRTIHLSFVGASAGPRRPSPPFAIRDAYILRPRTGRPKPEQVNAKRYICLIFIDPSLSSPSSELPGLNAFNHVGHDVMFDSLSCEPVVNRESVRMNYSWCPQDFGKWKHIFTISGMNEMFAFDYSKHF